MALSDIVNVSITTVDPGVTQAGFGTVLIFAHHTKWTTELVREYSSLTGLAGDGFTATEANGVYRAAQALLSQNPRVTKFKVGRRTTGSTQKLKITPTVQNSAVYSFIVKTPAGVEYTVSYTSDGSATAAEIITALETAVEAIAGSILVGTNDTTYLTVDAAAANTFYGFSDFTSNLTFEDVTADASCSAQLDAIKLEDPDFYGIVSTSRGNPEITVIAAWAEAQEKLFFFSTNQTTGKSATTGNIGKTLKDLSYARSAGMWNDNWRDFPEAAFSGRLLPYDPGSETWKFKTLSGATVDSFTETELGNMRSNNLNHYFTLAGRNITAEGKVASGEFIDVVRFRDWVKARIQERVFGLLASEIKVPFTDIGAAMVQAQVESVMQDGLEAGGIAPDPKPVVSVPLVSEVSAQDKSDRNLPDVTFTFTLAGAIHATEVSGTISV